MIEVKLAETLYCMVGINSPCLQSQEWAAWAQAALTVITFTGTVIYQARQHSKRTRATAQEKSRAQRDAFKREVGLARIVVGRELFRWRSVVHKALNQEFESDDEAVASDLKSLQMITWAGSVEELALLGQTGEVFVDLISSTAEIEEAVRRHSEAPNNGTPLDRERRAALWKELDSGIVRALKSMERLHERLN